MKKKTDLSWVFPLEEFVLLKIETLMISVFSIIIFVGVFFSFNQEWVIAVLFTVLFLLVYLLVAYLIQRYRRVAESYKVTDTHLHIERSSRHKKSKVKVALKNVQKHKVDKRFLGAYIVDKKGKKHPLFFNTKKDVVAFEKKLLNALKN